MSTSYLGQPAEVQAGWRPDRREIFVYVRLAGPDGSWLPDQPLVMSMTKPCPIAGPDMLHAAELAVDVRDALDPYGIALPDEFLGELTAHVVMDADSLAVRYDEYGRQSPVELAMSI